jgi:energy-coupling factor transporter ATP-binding protein EcfA2
MDNRMSMSREIPLEVSHLRDRLRQDFIGTLPEARFGSAADKENNFLSRALAAFTMQRLSGCTLDQAVAAVVDGAGDSGIDALHYASTSNRLWIVQSKFFADGQGEPSLGDVSKFKNGVEALLLEVEHAMRLRSIKYTEWEGTPQEWKLEGISLGDINLLVGKNASGKSRILNIISALAKHLAGVRPAAVSGDYDAQFFENDEELRYQVKFVDHQVLAESFAAGDTVLLQRGRGGEGHIFAEDLDGGKEIRFQTPPEEIAAVVRRDVIQHKFLEPLHTWGASVRHYYFGSSLGKDHLAVFIEKADKKFDENDVNALIPLYRKAEEELGEVFKHAVMNDMGQVDYDIEEIGLRPPISIRVDGNLPGQLIALYVKEKELAGITDQHSMSQGMFRVLSILIHLNYSQMTKKPTCILIDDIGEGLDFDRSCLLIDLLREKAKASGIQLVLSTNDRFVMNRIPLEEWSVLQRRGSIVRVLNSKNARDLFDEFRFTGLSNFSFLEMDFANSQPAEESVTRE